MKNYLYFEFISCCAIEGISPAAWAEKNGFGNSMPTNLKNGIRPSIETLKRLLSGFSLQESSTRILVAYLKDEIERLDFSLDYISPQINSKEEAKSSLDNDLKTIQEFMNHRTIRQSVHALAEILKVSEWAREDEAKRIRAQAEQDAVMHRLSAAKKRGKQQSERTA